MRIPLILILFIVSSLFSRGATTQQYTEKAEMVSLLYYNPQATVKDYISQGIYGKRVYIYPESAYYQLKVIRTNPKFRNKNYQFDKNKFHLFYLKAKKWQHISKIISHIVNGTFSHQQTNVIIGLAIRRTIKM